MIMKVNAIINKKILAVALFISLLIAVGVPSSTYAYNIYNYYKYIAEGRQMIDKDNLEAAKESFNRAAGYSSKNNSEIEKNIKEIEIIQKSKSDFEASVKLMNEKKYLEAIDSLKQVSKVDKLRYEDALNKINQCRDQYIGENIDKARIEAESKNYDAAIAILDTVIRFDSSIKEVPELKAQYENELKRRNEEKRIAEEKRIEEEKLALEAAKKAKELAANSATTKTNMGKSTQTSSQQSKGAPTIRVEGNTMIINDNGKEVTVQFMNTSVFYYTNFVVMARQVEPGTPGLPLQLDYKATFKHSSGESVVRGKTVARPSVDGPMVDLPSSSPITVTIEVTYNQKNYSFTTGFTTRSR
jgi:tetratricopeptide (TPR) repeat protein